MKRGKYFIGIIIIAFSCQEILYPEPVDLLTDDVVFNEPADVASVEIGLYNAFRSIAAPRVIAGDFTADMLEHKGTFSQYREFGTKQITAVNASVSALWGSIYSTVYIANFIIEKLPEINGVPNAELERVMAVARFLRAYAYFTAIYTYGGVPMVINTDVETNINIPRASVSEILFMIKEDYDFALDKVPEDPSNAGFVGKYAIKSALARYYLYLGDWSNAEAAATEVIDSELYVLEEEFSSIVLEDFTEEAILEVGYTSADDPGTSSLGLNNLFIGRREIIPSNAAISALASDESGDRFFSIEFDPSNLVGIDNGWSVAKYGTSDEGNNNIIVFRLGEIYLIRAEARANLNKIDGANSALSDLNMLRARANAPLATTASASAMLQLIENERRYELAFEGHRWYDLVRTDRARVIMPGFSSNWKDAYELWPIPQREIQNNPALVGHQNEGY